MRRRARRRFAGRQPVSGKDVIGHPGVPEFDRRHHDAPPSARGRVIWWTVLGFLALGFIALIVFTR